MAAARRCGAKDWCGSTAPNVCANANSADSHYHPSSEKSAKAIRNGDFVLIDIWGRRESSGQRAIYDITWTGVVDREPTEREQLVFETVKNARDAAIKTVKEAFASKTPIADGRRMMRRAR